MCFYVPGGSGQSSGNGVDHFGTVGEEMWVVCVCVRGEGGSVFDVGQNSSLSKRSMAMRQ